MSVVKGDRAPKLLTPSQFSKTPSAKKGSYASYVRYVTNTRAKRSAPPGSALAPSSTAQINAIVRGAVSKVLGSQGLFRPQTSQQLQAQATNYVQPQIDAQVKQITDEAGARARRGIGAIGSLTSELQSAQAPASANLEHNALMEAAARAAIGQSLGGAATAEGQQQQGAIAGKLAAIGNGGVSDVYAKNAGGLGAGIGTSIGTHAATGAADAVTRGSADAESVGKLPGIASLAAIRSGRMLQEQTNAGVADNVGKLEATVPGLVSGIYQNLQSRDLATRQARAGLTSQAAQLDANLRQHLGDLEVQKATARQGFGLDESKLGLSASIADQTFKTREDTIAAQNARAAAKQVTADAAARGKSAKAAQSALTKANGVAIAYLNKHVKPVPIYSTVTDTSTVPPTQKQVVTGYKGYPGYYDMIHGLESQVSNILGPYATQADIIRFAQRLVNNDPHYKPGVNGRPHAQLPAPQTPPPINHPLP